MDKKINIAIDGPVGAGKSTIAKLLAKKLNYIYVDTGAMYRTVSLKWVRQNNINENLSSEELQKKISTEEKNIVAITKNSKILLTQNEKIFLDDEDVSQIIRTPFITKVASPLSAIKDVRTELVKQQKNIAQNKGVIMEGRDIQTIVMPEAELKIFLTATASARAERRYREYLIKNIQVDKQTLVKDIEERDKRDSARAIAPLKKADDGIELDTTNLSIEQVVDKIYKLAQEKILV